ncbi:hypothetical protein Ndes2526A_g06534 [Nannochloris sp. 'desiccata']
MQEPSTPGVLRYQQFKVSGVLFECLSRYSLIRPIGKGAYGTVCSADDLITNERVAIKKIGNVFDSPLDARRTLREIRLLCRLRHENIVGLRDVFPPPAASAGNFQDIYMVYDLLDTDLHQIIRSPQLLSPDHVKFMAYQLVRGLAFLHSAGVVHRDLKPSNLLLNANCDLRICDFGLARTGVDTDAVMPEYVVTRWYRAPELLLSCTGYGAPIDMWSVGCIVAEMLGRKPLFPGRDYIHTLNLVCKVVGTPTPAEISRFPSEKAQHYLHSMPPQQPTQLQQLFPEADPRAIDLLSRLLTFDPHERITAVQALSHPYFTELHDPTDEPLVPAPLPSDPEIDTMPIVQVRDEVLKEMIQYNPDLEYM